MTSSSASFESKSPTSTSVALFGHVVGAEEIAHVVDRRRLEVRHAADRRVLVGVHRERLVVDDLVQPAVRLVLDAHPALFLDDLALGLEDLLVDAQRRHAVGLEPQHQRQVLRRHRLPEHRRVFVGVGVALPADARDVRRMPFGLDVLRALEHHVLEQVREAGAARLLVLRTDVIPELGVHDRRRVVLEQDHLQPVGQRRHRVIELGRPHRGAGPRVGRRAAPSATAAPASRRAPRRTSGAHGCMGIRLWHVVRARTDRRRVSGSSAGDGLWQSGFELAGFALRGRRSCFLQLGQPAEHRRRLAASRGWRSPDSRR